MTFPKWLENFLSAAGRWLLKQDSPTVLLFTLVVLVAVGLYRLPDIFDRSVSRVSAVFEADQERDQRTLEAVIDRIASDRRAAREQNLVGHP